ncbi:methylated-DNA--[protein]-cysteine S-methyltransferase [Telmatospirillum siberiense]|uniref:Methylated-DNA--protein-cysteine methyltransferase n=1 Tax=Telmatospirillum siberiense TaxID=382514 RepID=A0A2N3PMZ7_9PROT|nr:methylated-DNA--[protein]-cysteine S-methyltransferase [Telmatospirillum siberiense]PKU21771.1 cysteine methyltransferase [Telmatospirillum siberiense]
MSYHSFSSPLGDLTVFETDGKLVALEWGRVPGGDGSAGVLQMAERQLDDYFEGRRKSFDLPLDPDGSVFQKKVWAVLQHIPYGSVMSYGQIALHIDSAPRAVGGACGRNPLPVIIPCHRVVAAAGSLGGYSGLDGLDTKKFLLTLEGWPNH